MLAVAIHGASRTAGLTASFVIATAAAPEQPHRDALEQGSVAGSRIVRAGVNAAANINDRPLSFISRIDVITGGSHGSRARKEHSR